MFGCLPLDGPHREGKLGTSVMVMGTASARTMMTDATVLVKYEDSRSAC